MQFKFVLLAALCIAMEVGAQDSGMSNREVLASFGNMTGDCVDNDYSQSHFFVIPSQFEGDFYIRVFDPDCGGAYDKASGLWETNTTFEIYGGQGCVSEADARKLSPEGNYKSGELLASEIFARESEVDGKWVNFGPFKAAQGEILDDFKGYSFFKVIVEGCTGNDANLYSLAMSSTPGDNTSIQDTYIFEFERTVFENEQYYVRHFQAKGESDAEAEAEGLWLPIKLPELKQDPNFSISIEAVDN